MNVDRFEVVSPYTSISRLRKGLDLGIPKSKNYAFRLKPDTAKVTMEKEKQKFESGSGSKSAFPEPDQIQNRLNSGT